MRGAVANGLKLAGLVSVAGGAYDYIKENMFYFFGPITLNRIVGTAVGAVAATAVSMPFDTIATRMYTMRPLPNGEMPYKHSFDCFAKILKYEATFEKQSNLSAFYSGGQAYGARIFAIALIT
jgi:hypothetical protein